MHLANSYIEADMEEIKKRHPNYKNNASADLSPAQERELRVFGALEEMGVTVFGGACTSLGASAMLFLCWFQTFFSKATAPAVRHSNACALIFPLRLPASASLAVGH